MCPLRIILIFLSATLAGFFVLRNLKAEPELTTIQQDQDNEDTSSSSVVAGGEPLPLSTKVRSVICSGFWTCVDMASGRYLWRNLVSSKNC